MTDCCLPGETDRQKVEIDIELNKVNALILVLKEKAGLTQGQALRVVEILEQLT